jgi:hypothetical protein
MLDFVLRSLPSGSGRGVGTTELPRNTRNLLPAILFGAVLAGCAHPPPPVVMAPPPPPPVGHPYQVMVEVPPPTRHIRMTDEQKVAVQQAFNVIALKSALMVAALTCNQQDQYDQFMTEFQPHVLAEQHVMDAYFKRGGGYYGQAKEDDFVTLLANNQSVSGISQGAMFCLNNSAEYKAVLALRTATDLDSFVTDLPPDAPAVAAAGSTVTPLAPDDTAEHIAVVHSGHHVRLVKAHGIHSEHLAVSRATTHHHEAGASVAVNSVKPVQVSDTVSN